MKNDNSFDMEVAEYVNNCVFIIALLDMAAPLGKLYAPKQAFA